MNVIKYMKGFKVSFTFISLGFLLAITGAAAIANAQSPAASTSTSSPQARTDAVRASSSERREAHREEVMERRAALQARAQERITNLAANMSNRMEAAIARLQNVIDRLESRMEKLAGQGVLTAAATATLGSAQNELDRARETLADIDTQVAAMVGSETPRQSWRTLRETFTAARDAILLSHQGLRNTVAALKEAVAEAEVGEGRSDAVENATTSRSNAADESSDE